MNDIAHQRVVQELLKNKFGSHKILLGKYTPLYPMQAEREYIRATNAYVRILNEVLKRYMPEIRDLAAREKAKNARTDGIADLLSSVAKKFDQMETELVEKTEQFPLFERVEKMSTLTRKLSIAEWKRQVKATLGVELVDDYYMGELFSKLMQEWVNSNVDLIKTIPHDSLQEMRSLVLEGYRVGKPTTKIVKEIEHIYGVERRHARLIARDQIAKLNSQITRIQQEDAGVTEYIWSTSGDSRVRESHQALDGKRFRWDDPPVVDELTGRRCHPGEDYQCRCVALAVMDFDTVSLPVAINGGD